jgi:hypothetical protein
VVVAYCERSFAVDRAVAVHCSAGDVDSAASLEVGSLILVVFALAAVAAVAAVEVAGVVDFVAASAFAADAQEIGIDAGSWLWLDHHGGSCHGHLDFHACLLGLAHVIAETVGGQKPTSAVAAVAVAAVAVAVVVDAVGSSIGRGNLRSLSWAVHRQASG